MEKLSIIGNSTPEIGVLQDYTILEQNTFMLPQYRSEQEALVWNIYVLEKNGWRKTNGNTKVGKQVSYTFTQRSLNRKGIKIVVEQKGKKGELMIKPQPAKKPKILKVELLDINGKKVNKSLNYTDTLVAKAHCADMEGEQVYFTLWEDDAVGKGHHPDNEVNKINPIAIPSIVKKGVAEARFPMTQYYFASKIANIQAPKGSKDEGAHHEYYVTVEYRGKSTNQNKASNNVNLKNPEYQKGVEISNKNMGAKLLNERVSSKIVKIIETEQHIKIENGKSMSKVARQEKEQAKEETKCICKQYDLIWGRKIGCKERKKVVEVCRNIWGEEQKIEKANMLMAIMHLETAGTFSPSADNKKGYVGLIQFSGSTARGLGTTSENLKKMTFVEQMNYVEKYLRQNKDKMKTLEDFYLQVMKPSAVGNGSNPNFVIFDESIPIPDVDGKNTTEEQRKINITKEPWATKYGYSSNPSFMKEKDEKKLRKKWVYSRQRFEDRYGFEGGKTYVWEITEEIKPKHYDKGQNHKFVGECVEKEKEEKKVGKYPPWVDIAIKEENKIIRESTHCQYIIDNYHSTTTNIKMKYCGSEKGANRGNSAWCAAFVSYCLKTSGYKFQPDPGAIWHGKEKLVKRTKDGPIETEEVWGKKYSTMYIGGIVIWRNNAHTAIIIGIDKTNTNNYIIIGGNQNNGVRFWTIPKTKVKNYCIFPVDYEGDLLPLEEIEPSVLRVGAIKYKEGDTA